jgi:hypothetical protein
MKVYKSHVPHLGTATNSFLIHRTLAQSARALVNYKVVLLDDICCMMWVCMYCYISGRVVYHSM